LQAGTHVVRFLPSFVTTEEEVSEMIDALRESLREWSVQES
jgi:acetylornithine/succinyldiaminopimelate/putrescine aminotransferase